MGDRKPLRKTFQNLQNSENQNIKKLRSSIK